MLATGVPHSHVPLSVSYLLLASIFELRTFALAADPNIITKSQWHGEEAMSELTKLQTPVARVIILHTAGAHCADEAVCARQVRNIQNFHITLSFDDIGYNFLVGGDGNVYEGRGWEQMGASVKQYNAGSLSIAFIGNYETSAPNEQALNAAKSLLEMGVRLGKIAEDYKLYGHRQFSPTTSPGAELYSIIKQWPHWSRKIS